MKNLLYRVITAVILLPIVISLFLYGGIWLKILLALVGALCALEVANMVMPKSSLASGVGLLSFLGLMIPVVFFPPIVAAACGAISIVVLNIVVLFNATIQDKSFEKLCAVYFFNAYVFAGLNSLFLLQNNHEFLPRHQGLGLIFLACISTWGNDTFAYFSGKAMGKNPLFKTVSSKKTWEGFLGGACGGILLSFLLLKWGQSFALNIFTELSFIDFAFIALPSVFLAPLGDLCESKLKRMYQCKDSSNILPGHGGLLDRIDGLIIVLLWTAIFAFIIRPLC